jgi:hypothetical protein
MKNESIKIGKNLFRAKNPKRRMQLNAYQTLAVVKHKGRWIVALTEGWDREFHSCNTINRTDALRIISFLGDYVNLVKPTNETLLNASIKSSANRITRNANELFGEVVRLKHEPTT